MPFWPRPATTSGSLWPGSGLCAPFSGRLSWSGMTRAAPPPHPPERPNSLFHRRRALLDMAGSDAGVATWHQKFKTNFLRPVTAIRNANKLGNPALMQEEDWAPLLVTPAHPDYPSGHCAIGGGAVAND